MPIVAFCGLKKKYQHNLGNHSHMKEFRLYFHPIPTNLDWSLWRGKSHATIHLTWVSCLPLHQYVGRTWDSEGAAPNWRELCWADNTSDNIYMVTSLFFLKFSLSVASSRLPSPGFFLPLCQLFLNILPCSLLPLLFQKQVLNWAPSFPFWCLFK